MHAQRIGYIFIMYDCTYIYLILTFIISTTLAKAYNRGELNYIETTMHQYFYILLSLLFKQNKMLMMPHHCVHCTTIWIRLR